MIQSEQGDKNKSDKNKPYTTILLETSPTLSAHLDNVLEELRKRKVIKQKHTLLFIYGKIIANCVPKKNNSSTQDRWDATDYNNIKFWKTFVDYAAISSDVHRNDLFYRLRDIHIHSISGLKYYPNDPA
jgi:hypothetical protein